MAGADDPSLAELLASFHTVITLPVQWGDMDAIAHVNNVVYFQWLESSRVLMMDRLAGVRPAKGSSVGPILASCKCDYRRQTHYPDTVYVGSRIASVGRSSFVIRQAIVSREQKAVVAEGEAVIVLYDYLQRVSVPINDELRATLSMSSP
jgi:acyl-CoA thioester hydrolase